jgi:hypothetical protein
MYVYMYVYIYVCIYVCMYVYVYMRKTDTLDSLCEAELYIYIIFEIKVYHEINFNSTVYCIYSLIFAYMYTKHIFL